MMNSPLVEEASCQLAHQLTDFPEKQQISQLYRLAYGRQPTKSETNLARKYLKQFLTTPVITQEQQDNEAPALPMTAEFQALKLLCHRNMPRPRHIKITGSRQP